MKEIEEILEGSKEKDSIPFLQRRVIFLATKASSRIGFKPETNLTKAYKEEAIRLSEKINFEFGIAYSNMLNAPIITIKGKQNEIVDIHKKSIIIYKKIGNKFRKMNLIHSLGVTYFLQHKRRMGMRCS